MSNNNNNEYKLTGQDAADMLAVVLKEIQEAGIVVNVRNVPATAKRPAGLIVFAGGIEYQQGKGFAYMGEHPQNLAGGSSAQSLRAPANGTSEAPAR